MLVSGVQQSDSVIHMHVFKASTCLDGKCGLPRLSMLLTQLLRGSIWGLSLVELLHIVNMHGLCTHREPGMLYTNGVAWLPSMPRCPARPQTKHKFQDKTIKNFKMVAAED